MSEQRDDALSLEEVRARYVETETSLRAVKDHLEAISSARQTENDAATSLSASAASMRSVADAASGLVEELRQTVTSANSLLNASTGIINSSDLAGIRTGVDELRASVRDDAERTREVINAKVSQFHGKLDSGFRSVTERLDILSADLKRSDEQRRKLEAELAATRRRLDEATRLLGRMAMQLPPIGTSSAQGNMGFS
jgi:chromosome segregation ATPase